jgi:membrane protein DedA with SNARE-associated domain
MSRPLSARGHLYWIAFWLVFTAFVAQQVLTGDDESALGAIWLLVGLIHLAVLLAGYRTIRRSRNEAPRPSADDIVEGTSENEQRP